MAAHIDDAVARAREIAQRLAGGSNGASSSSGNRGGFSSGPPIGGPSNAVAAAAAAAAQSLLQQHLGGGGAVANGAIQAPSRFSDDPAYEPMSLALRIAFSLRQTPRATRKIFVPVEPGTNFMGLLLGPRGATLKDMTDRTGARIIIRGKGSHREGDKISYDDENEPLHVLIDGPEDSVVRAAAEVEALLFDPASRQQLKQQQLNALGADDPNAGALVVAGGALASWHVQPNPPRLGETTFECKVPNSMVGLIIGRGGENIKRLQMDHNVRVQIAKEPEPPEFQQPDAPTSLRRIAMTGNHRGLETAKAEIDELLRSRPAFTPGGAPYGARCMMTMKIANDKVGLVIGKNGATIRGIQERTGANVRVPPVPDPDDPDYRTLQITADSDDRNLAAKSEIDQLVAEELAKQQGIFGSDTVLFPVPEACVGLVIGKGGETIHRLQAATGARIQIPNQAEPGTVPPVRAVQITGTPDAQQRAQFEITQLVAQHEAKHGSATMLPSSPPIDPFSQPGYMGDPYAYQWHQDQQQLHPGADPNAPYAADPNAAAAAAAAAYWGYPPQQVQHHQPGLVDPSQPPPPGVSGPDDLQSKDQKPDGDADHQGQPSQQQQQQQQQPLAPDAYYADFWNYVGWYGEETARQVYGAYAPPPGTPPPPGTVIPQQQQQQQHQVPTSEAAVSEKQEDVPPGTEPNPNDASASYEPLAAAEASGA
ncbi:hypothetical protein CTAYLR_003077 [Chrysophaeum taylorii]|uniref:K Homology domain-containing protein n=1 Tax=Chrysophaeum taylorii TaxID=2483200 RepID=A0AAD7XHK7_9STRA|nr:hypothetical protein CTAYLR_003077 [Chrysophaeum taylorii]